MNDSVSKRQRQYSAKIYLSHSEHEFLAARKLANNLRAMGALVFMTDELRAGQNYLEKLRDRITQSDAVVVLLTPSAVASSLVLHELGAAWGMRIPIVPILTHRVVLNDLPESLRDQRIPPITQVSDVENAEFSEVILQSVRTLKAA